MTTIPEGERLVSRVVTVYYLKCPVISRKLQDVKETGECDP